MIEGADVQRDREILEQTLGGTARACADAGSHLAQQAVEVGCELQNYLSLREQLLNIAPSEISKRLEKVNSLINALKIYCA